MFPDSASNSIKFVLRDAMHEMEGSVEARGRAAFPGLDVVSRGLVSGTGGRCCRPSGMCMVWWVHHALELSD